MQYYSAVKKGNLPFATTWMELERTVLRQIPYDLTYAWNQTKWNNTTKLLEKEIGVVVIQGRE